MPQFPPGYAPALRRKCRSRQFLGAQSILYCTQIFLNFPEKHSCGKHSPYKFYLGVSTIYFSQPSCHRLEKKTPYLKLFLNTQMKKAQNVRLCMNIVKNRLAQYSWISASQFWSLAFNSHSSCRCQQGTSHLAEVGLKLLPSLKTYIWYMWHAGPWPAFKVFGGKSFVYIVCLIKSAPYQPNSAPPKCIQPPPI